MSSYGDRQIAARERDTLGAEFLACIQEFASRRGMSVRVAPVAVVQTDAEFQAEERRHRACIVADVMAGRLRAEVWL